MSESTSDKIRTAAVLGASPKADRYSHMAMMKLKEGGYPVIPVNPAYEEIEGLQVASDLAAAVKAAGTEGLDTVTVYIGAYHLAPLIPDIVAANPKRVIFNPGTENLEAQTALNTVGIPWLEACTLVLLATKQY